LLRAEARILLSQAKSLVDEHQAKVEEGKSVADEIRRRQAAMKVMGFDSLYTVKGITRKATAKIHS
jgi:predicted outer membrane protein